MHPVMSELGIYLAEHEFWTRQEAARKDRLVRDAVAHGSGRSMVARFVHAVRQFVDPRGYALSEMRPVAAATPPRLDSPVAVTHVTRLIGANPASVPCDHRVAA